MLVYGLHSLFSVVIGQEHSSVIFIFDNMNPLIIAAGSTSTDIRDRLKYSYQTYRVAVVQEKWLFRLVGIRVRDPNLAGYWSPTNWFRAPETQ